jgi:hypothetical protein
LSVLLITDFLGLIILQGGATDGVVLTHLAKTLSAQPNVIIIFLFQHMEPELSMSPSPLRSTENSPSLGEADEGKSNYPPATNSQGGLASGRRPVVIIAKSLS